MDGWMDGWIDGLMGGWMDGWVDAQNERRIKTNANFIWNHVSLESDLI